MGDGFSISLITQRGAAAEGQLAREFSKAQRRMQNRINRIMRELSREVPPIYSVQAPTDTGALSRSIKGKLRQRAARVTLVVSAEPDARGGGFAYLDVTRFGHRQPLIFARGAAHTTVAAHGTPTPLRARGGAKMTVYVHGRGRGGAAAGPRTKTSRPAAGSRYILRRVVRGYRPGHDWVNVADRFALAKVRRETAGLDRDIHGILSSMKPGKYGGR